MAKAKKPKISKLPKPKAASPAGRKTLYTEELGTLICDYLAEGMSLNKVCRRPDVPVAPSTVRAWALDANHPIAAQYARARQLGFMALHDDMLDDACNSSTEPGAVARDRLKVDTKKWIFSKMLPKTYGDKISQEITGKDGEPFYKKETPLETARWIAWILTQGDRELDRNGATDGNRSPR